MPPPLPPLPPPLPLQGLTHAYAALAAASISAASAAAAATRRTSCAAVPPHGHASAHLPCAACSSETHARICEPADARLALTPMPTPMPTPAPTLAAVPILSHARLAAPRGAPPPPSTPRCISTLPASCRGRGCSHAAWRCVCRRRCEGPEVWTASPDAVGQCGGGGGATASTQLRRPTVCTKTSDSAAAAAHSPASGIAGNT
eukprot:277761-Chlamydomonas_euryale.AAC.3